MSDDLVYLLPAIVRDIDPIDAKTMLARLGYLNGSPGQYLTDALLGGYAYPIGPVRKITWQARTATFTLYMNRDAS